MYKPAIGSVSINQLRPSTPHILGVYTEYLCYTLHVQTILDMHTHCAGGEHVVINRRKPVQEDRVQYSYHA